MLSPLTSAGRRVEMCVTSPVKKLVQKEERASRAQPIGVLASTSYWQRQQRGWEERGGQE